MDKNLFLAIALSVLIYVGWFSFMEKRYDKTKPASQVPVPGAVTAPGASAPAATSARELPVEREQTPPPSAAARREPEPGKGGLEGSIPLRAGGLEYRIQPLGASVVSYKHPGPLGPVELVEDPRPGFFSTWPEVRFSQVPGGEPAFEATLPSGVRVRKDYVLRGSGEMNLLRLTLSNPGRASVEVAGWAVDLGPGIGTVKSEQKENATLWRALACLPPEAGKKQEYVWDLSQFDFEKGERVAIAEDVFNNFQNTDNTLAEIAVSGADIMLLVGALNRSPVYNMTYKGLPVIASIREEYPEYEQDDPAVAADIAAGKLELEVKKNWARLCAAMSA